MTDKTPAEVFAPGDILREELEARGWTQADLAEILGRPPRLISEIITAKRAITPETAKGLGEALGTGAQLWMNLETQYQLSQTKSTNSAIGRRAKIYGQFPVKEMQKRRWLVPSTSLDAIETELQKYFQIPSLDHAVKVAHAAKKTSYEKFSMLQAAWLMRAQQLAATVTVSNFAAVNLDLLYKGLRTGVQDPIDSSKVAGLLSKAGIRLVIVEALPGSKIDGACLWYDSQPLIALTLRYDRHDIFWHVLFHELDHIKHGEGKSEPIVDSNLLADCSHGVDTERRANAAAASTLIPTEKMEQFVSRHHPFYSERTLGAFAAQLGVHPGIVVGQLQHRKLVPWSAYSRFRAKIRDIIVPTTVTDGFEKHAK